MKMMVIFKLLLFHPTLFY